MRRRLSSSELALEVVAACHMVGCSRKVEARRARGAVVPRAGRWLCRDALPTTSYPCRPVSPDTPFRVRHNKRVLDPAEGRPIYGIGAGSHRPAQVGYGRPLPAGRHAPRYLALLASFLLPFQPNSFVRPAPRTFFRPDHNGSPAPRRADLVKAGPQGHPSPTDLALTRSSTAPG